MANERRMGTRAVVTIYVALLDEGVDAWRPVMAERLSRDIYKIADQPYDRAAERWRFKPGDEVVCAMVDAQEGRMLAAIALSGYGAE